MTKLPEELHHILGEVVVGLIYSLACTERAFDLIPLSHGLVHLGLTLGTWRFLGRP